MIVMELTVASFEAFTADRVLLVAAVVVAVSVVGGLLVMLVGGRG